MADDIMGAIDGLLVRQARVTTILNGDPELGTPGLIAEMRGIRTLFAAFFFLAVTNLILTLTILGVLWSIKP